MNQSPADIFKNRASQFEITELDFQKKATNISWVRLLLFLVGGGTAIYLFFAGNNVAGFAVLAVAYVLFILILRYHNQVKYQQNQNKFLRLINEQELLRLDGKLSAFDSGKKYLQPQHPYAADLDIFGNQSLFQLLNRATTAIGKDRLAGWLNQMVPGTEIKNRQAAVADLLPQLDWRQNFLASAMHYKQPAEEVPDFFGWLREPDFFKGKLWLKALVFIMPPLSVLAILAGFSGYTFYYALGLIAIQYFLSIKFTAQRDAYYDNSSGMYDVLRTYKAQFMQIEHGNFTDDKLKALQQHLLARDGKPASAQAHDLARIVDFFSVRLSTLMAFFVNAILMWDFYWMFRLERWKKNVAADLQSAFNVIAEFEALASLAAFQYANPGYVTPEISEAEFEVAGTDVGHPLIFVTNRITNNFETKGPGKTMIITGSNMSGKTTFLRTVGINMVLAFAGAAVCAARFRVWPVQVFTAMRTEDNLAESTSSFYAELKRLKILLDMAKTNQPVFYFLDEILKGTNSRDRHLGAVALVRQLHKRPASGLISTHDLELGQLQEELPESVKNYSFNSTLEADKILFDYKLTPGVCHSFNASKLMQQMGIEMER